MVARIVIGAASSGSGKTTIATGLMAALANAGEKIQAFKIGPDYIDPGYHSLATGRPSRNLDPILTDTKLIWPLFLHGITSTNPGIKVPGRFADQRWDIPAEIAIIEGVMGLFDGKIGAQGLGSTADIAKELAAPVIILLDAAHTSRTAAAALAGLNQIDATVNLAGVIINRVSTPRQGAELAKAIAPLGIPLLGIIPKDSGFHSPSRHLGLVPVAERDTALALIDYLAQALTKYLDLDAILAIAKAAPPAPNIPAWLPEIAIAQNPASVEITTASKTPPLSKSASSNSAYTAPVIAVAGAPGFTFYYPENLEILQASGAKLQIFDPITDSALPPNTSGIYLGGGFPEILAAELSQNTRLLREIQVQAAAGIPIYAECGGQLYLSEFLEGYPMVGALPIKAVMTPKLTLGYREATALENSWAYTKGQKITGHEFHRTLCSPAGEHPAWSFPHPVLGEVKDGYIAKPKDKNQNETRQIYSSYLHLHWASCPQVASAFVTAAREFQAQQQQSQGIVTSDQKQTLNSSDQKESFTKALQKPSLPDRTRAGLEIPEILTQSTPTRNYRHWHYHGDNDSQQGNIDSLNLAVNLRRITPPDWLVDILAAELPQIGHYPDPQEAITALAAAHNVTPEMVLPTAGAAEAFTLIAQGIPTQYPLIIEPQFTEPRAALAAAGKTAQALTLVSPFTFATKDIYDWADLVFIGNPTNPTGVLHKAQELREIPHENRILVVDEAFISGLESQSLIAKDMENILVIRSITKVWGLAGLRAGYVIGDPKLIAKLRRVQTHWSVSRLALKALSVTAGKTGLEDLAAQDSTKTQLCGFLKALGCRIIPGNAPFILVQTPWAKAWNKLQELGITARSCDNFLGLDSSWLRLAIPRPEQITQLQSIMEQYK